MVDIYTETDMFGRPLLTREVELLLWALVIFLLILFAVRFWRLSRKVSPETFVNIHAAEFLICILFAIAKVLDILYDFYIPSSMAGRHVLEQISLTLGFAGFTFLIWVIEKTIIKKTRFILSLIPILGIVYIWIGWIGPTGPSFDLIFIIIMVGITLVPFATYIVSAFLLKKEIRRQALLVGIGLILVIAPFGLEYEVLIHLDFGVAIINFYNQLMTALGMAWDSYYFWPQQMIVIGFVFLYYGILKYWK